MSDLINRSDLLKCFCVTKDGRRIPEVDCDNMEVTVSIKDVKKIIRRQPTIEAVPVVHAEWKLKQGDEGVHWYCSKCREEALFDIFNYQEKSNFCPNCGAKMERSTAYYNDGWIPCSSGKMPENGRRCWVTYEWANGSLHVDKDYLVNGKWFETEDEAVKAWMYNDEETPEPYKPKGEK